MSKNVYARLSDEDVAKLEVVCSERKIKRSEFMREAVERHLNSGEFDVALKEELERTKNKLAAAEEINANLEGDLTTAQLNVEEAENKAKELEQDLQNSKDLVESQLCELKKETTRANEAELKSADLTKQSKDLDDARNCAIQQRDKFKACFEETAEAFEKLKGAVQTQQDLGYFARASKRNWVNLAGFSIPTGEESVSE